MLPEGVLSFQTNFFLLNMIKSKHDCDLSWPLTNECKCKYKYNMKDGKAKKFGSLN